MSLVIVAGLAASAGCGSDPQAIGSASESDPPATGSASESDPQATGSAKAPATEAAAAADGGERDPRKIDPCGLLTAAEIAAVVGTELPEKKTQVVTPARLCTFSKAGGGLSSVTVGVVDIRKSEAEFQRNLETAAKILDADQAGIVDVPGLGDVAAYADFLGDLHVLKDGIHVMVRDDTKDYPDGMPPTLPKLMEKAIARI